MKRKDRGFPYDAAPDVHQFRGVPQNLFPLIGPEMPERWRHMSLGKDDLDSLG